MRVLGIIGAGAMAGTVLQALAEQIPASLTHLAMLVIEKDRDRAADLLARLGSKIAVSTSIHVERTSFLAQEPELVAECAGHNAVAEHGPHLLAHGCNLIVVSVGALADDNISEILRSAAGAGRSRLIITAGAVGGLDVLGAARISGLKAVMYRGRKPPGAWRGTLAEMLVPLDSVRESTVFFRGTAREAARAFPQNANVAAAVALAGAGFDATSVELVADPTITSNIHEVTVQSACINFTVHLEGLPSAANPKTSLTAGYNVARSVINEVASVTI